MFFKIQERSTQTCFWVFVEQGGNQGVHVCIFHVLGEFEGVLDDLLVNLKGILCILSKRNKSCHELVEDDTKGPEVYREGIAFSCKSFWSHIVGGSNHSESLLSSIEFLTCTKINQFQVAVSAYHHILRLQISIYKAFFMESFNNMKKLGSIESSLVRVQ